MAAHSIATEALLATVKDEASIPVDKFLDGLRQYALPLEALLRDRYEALFHCLRGRLNLTRDDLVTLAEIRRLIESSGAPTDGRTDVFNVLHSALIVGPLRDVNVGAQPNLVTVLDMYDGNTLATGDCEGVVRVWRIGDNGMSRIASFTVGPAGTPVSCVHFVYSPADPLRLLAAVGDRILVLNPFASEVVCSVKLPDRHPVTVMATEGRRLFTATGVVGVIPRVWKQPEFDQPFIVERILGLTEMNYEMIQVLGNGKHVALLQPTKWPQVFDYTKGTTVICSGLEGATTICTDVNTHELCVGGSKWEYEVVDPENPVTRKSVMPVYLQPSRVVPYHNTAFQHIQVTRDGMIHFGSHNSTRGGPYSATWITALPTNVECSLTSLVSSAKYDGCCALAWKYGPDGASGLTVFRTQGTATPPTPTLMVSSVGSLNHSTIGDVSPKGDNLNKTFLVPVVLRQPGTSPNREPRTRECAFLSAYRGNTLHVWNSAMELVGDVCLWYVDGVITALIVENDDVFIGTSTGQLFRVRLPSLVRSSENREATAAERRALHYAHVKHLLTMFKEQAKNDVKHCLERGRWKVRSLNGGVQVERRLAALPRVAQELCAPLTTFFADLPAFHVNESKAAALLAAIDEIDVNAMPLDNVAPGVAFVNTTAYILCDVITWTPVASTRICQFSDRCTGCQGQLQKDEDRWCGSCLECSQPQVTPNGVTCRTCLQRRTIAASTYCEVCYENALLFGTMAPMHVLAPSPDTLIVAAQNDPASSTETFGGCLLVLDRATLIEVSREENSYLKGWNNCVKVPQLEVLCGGPVFATMFSHVGIGFFRCDRHRPLANQLVGAIKSPHFVKSITIDPTADVDPKTGAVTIVVSLGGIINTSVAPACRRVTFEKDRRTGVIKVTEANVDYPDVRIDPRALLAVPGALFSGRAAGDVIMATLNNARSKYTVVGTLHGHDFGSPSTMLLHPVSGSLITVYSDASFAIWPRDLFKPRSLNNQGHTRGPRNGWLLKTTDGEVRAVVGHGYEYRPLADQESGWLSLTSGVGAAEQLLATGHDLQVRNRYDIKERYRFTYDYSNKTVCAAIEAHPEVTLVTELITHHRTKDAKWFGSFEAKVGQPLEIDFVDFNSSTALSTREDASYVVKLMISIVNGPVTLQLREPGNVDPISDSVEVTKRGQVLLKLHWAPVATSAKLELHIVSETGSVVVIWDSSASGFDGPLLARSRVSSEIDAQAVDSATLLWSMPFSAKRHGSA